MIALRRRARRAYRITIKPLRLLFNAWLCAQSDAEIERLTGMAADIPKLITRQNARKLDLARRRNDITKG